MSSFFDVHAEPGVVWLRLRVARSAEIMTLKLTHEMASELGASLCEAANAARGETDDNDQVD